MSNTKKIVGLIREIVKQEVQKEVRKILISEGAKAISNNVNDVPEVIPTSVPKKTKPKDCPECCGEGFDLDHFYETGGEEEDCYMCGGTGKE